MTPPDALADEILRNVAGFVKKGGLARLHALDAFPVAIYVTDFDGFITYFNPACIEFAGRTPTVNQDRWCVSWKLYTNEGDFLPHEQCPMAVAIQTRRAVRGVTAVAERPNGMRIRFQPFPTPVVSETGELLGAINMLVDLSAGNGPAPQEIPDHPPTSPSEHVKQALETFKIADVKRLVEEMESELSHRPPRLLH